jgi:hypothetical protein
MQKLLAWHHLTPQEVILALQSKLSGLTTAEATKRLEEISHLGIFVASSRQPFNAGIGVSGGDQFWFG